MTLAVQYGVTHMPVYRSAVILLFELVASAITSQWLTNEFDVDDFNALIKPESVTH